MPETRYREEYSYPEGMAAKDKVAANAIRVRIPYEVSDKQLDEEAEAEEVQQFVELLPNTGINRVLKRLLKKGLLA